MPGKRGGREIWVADCETDPFKFKRIPQPFLWGLYNGCDYYEFRTTGEFIAFVREREIIVYAHNGGKFDWHYIISFLEEETGITIIAGRLAKFKIGQAEFRDSFNLLPVSLDKYKKVKIDYQLFEKSKRQKHMTKIRRYLRSDCVNLYEIVMASITKFGRKLTLAGQAMSYWEKTYGRKADHSSQFFYSQLADYYYGGRVECFRKGFKKQAFKVYDINSAYPEAMQMDHPAGLQILGTKRLPKTDARISRCFITIVAKATGAFPFRDSDNSLVFPSDQNTRTFKITGWEYLAARDLGLLDATAKIIQISKLSGTVNYAGYVREFFARKSAAKAQDTDERKAEYLLSKFMLNTLYGKNGSNPGPGRNGNSSRYKEYKTCRPDEISAEFEIGGWEPIRLLHNVAILVRDLPPEQWRFFNVGTAASITGFVRAKMLRALHSCIRPLYCDTDSIACVGGPFDIGKECGQWSIEGEYTSYAIAGKKLYAFFGPHGVAPKMASKGAKLTAKQIKQIAKGKEITYKKDAPTYGVSGIKWLTRKIKMT